MPQNVTWQNSLIDARAVDRDFSIAITSYRNQGRNLVRYAFSKILEFVTYIR
jgi:hypothetical protein